MKMSKEECDFLKVVANSKKLQEDFDVYLNQGHAKLVQRKKEMAIKITTGLRFLDNPDYAKIFLEHRRLSVKPTDEICDMAKWAYTTSKWGKDQVTYVIEPSKIPGLNVSYEMKYEAKRVDQSQYGTGSMPPPKTKYFKIKRNRKYELKQEQHLESQSITPSQLSSKLTPIK